MSTVIISIILTLIVIGIIARLIKNKKAGKSSCGCGCAGCALKDKCNKQ